MGLFHKKFSSIISAVSNELLDRQTNKLTDRLEDIEIEVSEPILDHKIIIELETKRPIAEIRHAQKQHRKNADKSHKESEEKQKDVVF